MGDESCEVEQRSSQPQERFMSTSNSGFSTQPTSGSSATIHRDSVHNEILLLLPKKEYQTVLAELSLVEMRARDVLNEIGEPINDCYFVNTGMVSILSVMSDGKSVEVGLTGKEGFVGLPMVVGLSSSATRAVTQVAGQVFRLRSASLARILAKCSNLEKSLNRYSQQLALQASQVAACNRLHEVDQRMARWLLMTQDRISADVVPLTQEFLAHMLGTRRASVTVAAGVLQKAGLIKYTRGSVVIVNRGKLQSAACECYKIIIRQSRNWQAESQ
jgi:CRP-like cAMP-binding protein